MISRAKRLWVLVALGCSLGSGCGRTHPYVTAERRLRGLVIVLPGIEGRGWLNAAICRGLNEGGVNWAVELHDWTTGVPGNFLYHLRAEGRNRRQAAAIAERIGRYNARYPGRPVVLVGQSGGGAVAAWVAEAMPSPEGLTGVVMLSPALSPGYDLRAALANSKRGMVNFYSRRDWVFLGVGTSMWGTMDGKLSSSAGRVSFGAPEAASSGSPYAKLFQLAWNREMSDSGHVGGHLSSGASEFVAKYVAPLILAEKWDEQLMVRVQTQDWAETPAPRLPPPNQWRPEPVPRDGPRKSKGPDTRPAGADEAGGAREPGPGEPGASGAAEAVVPRWDRLSMPLEPAPAAAVPEDLPQWKRLTGRD